MDKKVRILIISAEVWRDDTNGGNVLSNIFKNTGYEFAQIYCNPGNPSNHLCKLYYQMTDSMMIKSILWKTNPGLKLEFQEYPSNCKENKDDRNITVTAEGENRKLYNFFRDHRLEIFYVIRSLIWKIAQWNTSEFKDFIVQYNPDLIFAPCYASHELLAIDRAVKDICKVPMISYISDDNYGLKQFRLSPVYWINRLILRKNMRKTFKQYALIYTMTKEQKDEYEKLLHCKMKILRKSGDFSSVKKKITLNQPIRLIYAGGIYCGRWKTLAKIAAVLKNINKDSVKIVLDIYTGNRLTNKQEKILNDGVNSVVHDSISQTELKKRYAASDIALHVESFDLKYKLLTRLSFSTKIIDCLMSGCAVMAICWRKHSGYIYLKENDIAICIDDERKIDYTLKKILLDPNILIDYANKALKFGIEHHQYEDIKRTFMKDLESFVKS